MAVSEAGGGPNRLMVLEVGYLLRVVFTNLLDNLFKALQVTKKTTK